MGSPHAIAIFRSVPASAIDARGCALPVSAKKVRSEMDRRTSGRQQPFFSISELAVRWRCSRGTVYNRLRFDGAKVLHFGSAGKKGKKLVPALTVFQIESKYLKVLP